MGIRSPRLARSPAPRSAATGDGVRLADWLLTGPAQIAGGAHAGAVAGGVDAEGRPRYAYPEITGYYLHWLAWQAARRGGDARPLAPRAEAAQRWLARWLDTPGLPPTRIPLTASDADWRNGALFCFDVAMVLRGVAAAARERILVADAAVIARLVALLRALVQADGEFAACVPRGGAGALPARWSTRRGPFLAKAAAGVLRAAREVTGVPPDVVAAAEATHAASTEALVEEPHTDVHPLLYAFEGVLSLPEHPRFAALLPAVAAQFEALLETARKIGHVPESLASPDESTLERCDAMAQTVRVGHLLACHCPASPLDRVGLSRIARALARRIRPHGALPFASGAATGDDNVWATMFAEQALALPAWGHSAEAGVRAGAFIV
jgi:hypothetical protein